MYLKFIAILLACIVNPFVRSLSNVDHKNTPNAPTSFSLSWQNVTASSATRTILKIDYGSTNSGRLLAIMGPSGSGKTTLLKILAHRMTVPKLRANGIVKLSSMFENCIPLKKNQIAFIYQDDAFFPMLLVKETLLLTGRLKSLITSEMDDVELITSQAINALALNKVEHSIVGEVPGGNSLGGGSRGISGGERKRLAVANGLLGNPLILVADEPTSGLDSFQAFKVVQLLHEITHTKNIITIISIHQPRTSIWNVFDDVLLLSANGNVAYHGPRDEVLDYFHSVGYDCPDHMNPAEFIIDLVSIDTENATTFLQSKDRIDQLVHQFNQKMIGKAEVKPHHVVQSKHHKVEKNDNFILTASTEIRNSLTRVWLLFLRAAKQNFRDFRVNLVKMSTSVVLAVVISILYGSSLGNGTQGLTEKSVSDRVNIIANTVINVGMLSTIKTLQLFKRERGVVDRERSSGEYSASEYLLGKSLAEFPLDAAFSAIFAVVIHQRTKLLAPFSQFVGIIALLGCVSSSLGLAVGALSPSADIALAIGPALMVVYVLLGTIGPAGTGGPLPYWLDAVHIASPMKWACEGLCTAEFRNQPFITLNEKIQIENHSNLLKYGLHFIRRRCSDGAKFVRNIVKFMSTSQKFRNSAGDQVLSSLGIDSNLVTTKGSINSLWIMFVVHSTLTLLGLVLTKPKE